MVWNLPNLDRRSLLSGGFVTQNDVYAFAQEQADRAFGYVVDLVEGVNDLTPPTIEAQWPSIESAPIPVTTTTPAFEDVVWVMPGLPTEFSGTLDVDEYLPEPFDDNPPTLTYGTAPTAPTDAVPEAPGIDFTYEDPTLSINLPAAPDLLSLNVQSFDGVTLPTIDFEIPELTIAAPDVVDYTPGDLYTSALLQAMQAELLDRITNGGTGLAPDVEQGIWDRARQREIVQTNDSLAELERMETLGYAFPSGVYLDARLKLTQNLNYNSDTLSRDIAIAQAELEQKNVQQALEVALRLEGTLIEQNNAVEQRLFESARYATEAGIAIYNAKVNAYTAYVDAYKAKIAIYEAQVRAELARVDAYRAEVAAEEAKARVNVALVDQYKAQIDAALANVEVFKAEVLAIQSKAEIEKLKVAIYGEEIRAYSAKVNAYTAGVEGFKASIDAEVAKQDAYRSRVTAYAATVDANVKAVDARISEFQAQLSAKELEWEGYKAAADAQKSRAQAIAASNQTTADAYRAEVSAVSAYNDAMTKQWEAAVDLAERVAEVGVSAAKANGELYVTTRSLALDAAKVGAQVSAQLGGSAMGVLSLSESYNNSNSASFSTSYAYSANESYSASV